MSGRAVQVGGLALLGGAAYYFYQAGGDPKVAQKKVEADAAKLSANVKDTIPGTGKQVQKDAELAGSQISSKLSQFSKDAKTEASKAEATLEQYRKDAASSLDKTTKDVRNNTNAAIDKFDKEVTEGAGKAKSTVSSWFGGK